MIEELYLIDFQSHKNTLMKFDKGVNIIIGESDCGKTSIIRALNWVINNKPNGDSFIRNGSDGSMVELTTDGCQIKRTKTDKENKYSILTLDSETDADIVGFGQAVPEEISKLLNFTDINMQSQMDAPFLLSKTPGEVSKYLNKIVNLDSIDLALSKIASLAKSAKVKQQYTADKIKGIDEKFVCYHTLDSIIVENNAYLKRAKEFEKITKEDDRLSDLIVDYRISNSKLNQEIVNLDIKKISTERIQGLNKKLDGINRDSVSISKLIESHNVTKKNLHSDIDSIDSIDASTLPVLWQKFNDADSKCDTFEVALSEIEKSKDELKENKTNLSITEKEYEKMKPSECPLCKQEWKV